MPHNNNLKILPVIICLLLSCNRVNLIVSEDDCDTILSATKVRVPSDGIFGRLQRAGGGETKSFRTEDECYLIDLLDIAKRYTRTHDDGSRYTAIAFKSNETAQYYALTSHLPDAGEGIGRDSTLRAKNFFIYRELSGRTTGSVVTMLSTYGYYRSTEETERSILYMHDYVGYVLFSDLSGRIYEVEYYDRGRVYRLRIYGEGETTHYLTGVTEMETKSTDTELDPAVCVADRTRQFSWVTGDFNYEMDEGDEEDKKRDFVISFPGGGGGSSDSSEDGDLAGDALTKLCEVAVYSSDEEKGKVTGAGNYVKGEVVEIEAVPVWEVPSVPTVFNYWTGDLEREGASVTLQVEKDVCGVAYFSYPGEEQTRPCVDTLNGLVNMCKEMSIAPTRGGYRGGTFGMTRVRDGIPRMHKGIDIYAEKGTPIYCQYGGIVYEVRDSFNDDIEVVNSHGNRIIIQSGTKLYFYCHLQGGGKTIGYNYREGRVFKKGDRVYPGEIIGYAGSTGNAKGTTPHVHFEVHDNGEVVDPSAYINGSIKVNTGEITEIRCDELVNYD